MYLKITQFVSVFKINLYFKTNELMFILKRKHVKEQSMTGKPLSENINVISWFEIYSKYCTQVRIQKIVYGEGDKWYEISERTGQFVC